MKNSSLTSIFQPAIIALIGTLVGLRVGGLSFFCLLFLAVNHSKAGNELGLGLVLGLGIRSGIVLGIRLGLGLGLVLGLGVFKSLISTRRLKVCSGGIFGIIHLQNDPKSCAHN